MRRSRDVVIVFRPKGCDETIARLEGLLQRARAGAIVGLAYVAIEAHTFEADLVGRAAETKIMTRGMLLALDDLLRDP